MAAREKARPMTGHQRPKGPGQKWGKGGWHPAGSEHRERRCEYQAPYRHIGPVPAAQRVTILIVPPTALRQGAAAFPKLRLAWPPPPHPVVGSRRIARREAENGRALPEVWQSD